MVTMWDFPGGPVVKISPSNAGDVCSTPGQGAEISYASWPKHWNVKQKWCNKFNKDFRNDPLEMDPLEMDPL